MSAEYKINSNLFNSLNELIRNPFFIMDQQGNLFSFNKSTSDLFNNFVQSKNLFDIIDPASAERLNILIEKTLSGESPYKEPFNIVINECQIQTKLSIVPYLENNHTILFCELERSETNKKIKQYNLKNVIHLDPEITNLIENISGEFPLTLTGKDQLRNKLDDLSYIVWLEDLSGNFLLINQEFQSSFRIKYSSIVGKAVNNYIVPLYQPLWDAVNKLVQSDGLTIKLENLSINGIGVKEDQETIKTPVVDSRGNTICIIGIIKTIREEEVLQEKTSHKKEVSEYFISLIKHFPKASALISIDGTIISYNNSFALLFKDGLFDQAVIQAAKIFPAVITEMLIQFMESDRIELNSVSKGNYFSSGRKIESFHVYLYKIINNDVIEGIFIMVEEEVSNDNLENVIKKRGRMFEILLEKNPEPVFIYDTENLRFLEVNEAALNLYGYKKEEFLQMDLTDLYTPEDIQTLLDSSVIKDNYGKFYGPFRHRKKDGSSVLVEISKVSFKYNDKDAHYNVIKDVSEMLELKKQMQLYKSAFDNSQSLVFITDSGGFVTYANKAVYDLLKYTKAEINNTSFAAFVKNEERATVNTSIFQAHIKDAVTLNIELKKADGGLLNAEINASPVLDYKGEVDSFIIICNYEIKPEQKEVTMEVPSSPAEPKNISSEMDKNFLSSMFHEILTPINVIIGFIQELTDLSGAVSPEQKEAIDIINQNRITLLNSMNSIVEYLSVERNDADLKIQEISITETIDFLQKDVEELAQSKDIEFSYGKISSSLRFETDKQKFQHLISVLLRLIVEVNASKKIYFSAYQYSDNKFAISIKDGYSNVSKGFLDKIKAMFGDGNTKDFHISKLSMNLAKKLLKILNGSFELLNKADEKSDYAFIFSQKFTFINNYLSEPEVPNKMRTLSDDLGISQVTSLKKGTAEDYEEIPASKVFRDKYDNGFNGGDIKLKDNIFTEEDLKIIDGAKDIRKSEKINLPELSCLYIEDQIDSQILFKVQMKELKDIKFAVSFEEALPLLDNYHFDFIVMDINLQGEYNGLDALKIIHKMPSYEKIPIIAVTAYVLPGDKEKFIATGFHDFISKPIFREKMMDSLERIFLMQF